MQLAQGHNLNANLALVLPAFRCCIPLLCRLVPKMVLTLQLALVVFFFGALAHLLMRILQLALCGGGIYRYVTTLYI